MRALVGVFNALPERRGKTQAALIDGDGVTGGKHIVANQHVVEAELLVDLAGKTAQHAWQAALADRFEYAEIIDLRRLIGGDARSIGRAPAFAVLHAKGG